MTGPKAALAYEPVCRWPELSGEAGPGFGIAGGCRSGYGPLMRRLPIRVKVTAVFAIALAFVLAGTGLFLFLRFSSGLDHTLDQGLRSRAGDVTALVKQADSGLIESGASSLTTGGEGFAQILAADGAIFDSTAQVKGAALLDRLDVRRALAGSIFVERGPIGRIDDRSRLLATPVHAQGRQLVVVVGVGLHDRDGALRQLGTLLLIGGAVALVLASFAGYTAIAAALRPVESMRRRASEISASEPGQRLPVALADDEVSRLSVTLNAMLTRLEDAFARERRFVSDASHELRTPLGILKTELEVAVRGAYSKEDLEAAIRSASVETDRVVQLAEDLLVIARADQGQLPMSRVDIELAAVLGGVRDRFERRAAEQDRVIVVNAPAGCRVSADALRLEQALGNLVDNALRHGAGPITIAAVQTAAAVELHVTDEGNGFPPALAGAAFDRFSRGDQARGRGGAGLGLAIVQAIAAAHGGHAQATNRDGISGADVWITIAHSS